MSRIGIVGAGNVGATLAKRLVDLGHAVKIANSRGPQSLGVVASRTGAQAVPVAEIASDVDVLIVAVPFGKIRDLTTRLRSFPLQDVAVVDTGNYIPQRDGAIADIDEGLPETAWVARQLGLPVVKAFNSITTYSLEHYGRGRGDPDRIASPVGGDDPNKRAIVMGLVEQLGFEAVDAGPLLDSWRQQPGQPAYASDPTAKELPVLLARADRQKGPLNRDEGMKTMARLPSTFPQQELVRILRLRNGLDRFKPRSWASMLILVVTMLRHKTAKA